MRKGPNHNDDYDELCELHTVMKYRTSVPHEKESSLKVNLFVDFILYRNKFLIILKQNTSI